MSIYLLKSIMAIAIILVAMISIYTMFEIFGRSPVRVNVAAYKRIHKITGYIYIVIFIFVSYFCLNYIFLSRAELSPRSNMHAFLSLCVLVLFGMKILITRVYKHFYHYVNILGIAIALITFGVVGTSAAYYLIVSRLGTDASFDKMHQYNKWAMAQKKEGAAGDTVVASDQERINRGKILFEAKCIFCHDPKSKKSKVGPGLTGILKNAELPVSRRPATPQNIREQFKKPFGRMPSFEYLSKQEVNDLLAFLKTL